MLSVATQPEKNPERNRYTWKIKKILHGNRANFSDLVELNIYIGNFCLYFIECFLPVVARHWNKKNYLLSTKSMKVWTFLLFYISIAIKFRLKYLWYFVWLGKKNSGKCICFIKNFLKKSGRNFNLKHSTRNYVSSVPVILISLQKYFFGVKKCVNFNLHLRKC